MIFGKPTKRNKYGAQRTVVDGISFPSKLEAAVYSILKNFQKIGVIENLSLQSWVRFPDQFANMRPDFKFTFTPLSLDVYGEAKGMSGGFRSYGGDRWARNRKIWIKHGPAPLIVWRGRATKPILFEVIGPMVNEEVVQSISRNLY